MQDEKQFSLYLKHKTKNILSWFEKESADKNTRPKRF